VTNVNDELGNQIAFATAAVERFKEAAAYVTGSRWQQMKRAFFHFFDWNWG